MERLPEFTEKVYFTDKGMACSGKARDAGETIRHLPDTYTIVSDETSEGVRTIVLKEVDSSERMRKTGEIVGSIASALKENRSKTFKDLLTDILLDSWDEEIDELYHKIVEKKEAIVAEEGCFKLIIGTGSKQKEIMMRE